MPGYPFSFFRGTKLVELSPAIRTLHREKYAAYKLVINESNNLYEYQLVIPHDVSFSVSETKFDRFYNKNLKDLRFVDDIKNDKVAEAIPLGGNVKNIFFLDLVFYDTSDFIQFGFGIEDTNIITFPRLFLIKKNSRTAFWSGTLF